MESDDSQNVVIPQVQVTTPKKRKSEGRVQQFVMLHFDKQEKSQSCRKCKKSFALGTSNTSLLYHLKNSHKIEQDQPDSPKSSKITKFFEPPLTERRKNELNMAIATYITRDMKAVGTVEGQGFKSMMRILQPNYTVPHRTTFSRTLIPNLYEEKKGIILHSLQVSKCKKSITTDLWTDNYRRRNYVTTTCHYIEDWKLNSLVLETTEFGEVKTGENLATHLKEVCSRWFMDEPFVVSDNGGNIIKAVEILKWTGFRCFAHTLNLSVTDGIKLVTEVQSLIDKIRKIISHLRYKGPALIKKGKEILLQLKLDGEYNGFDEDDEIKIKSTTLKRDIVTRWNSILTMIKSVDDNYTSVKAVLFDDSEIELMLTVPEIELNSQLIEFLTCFLDATNLLSGQKYPSISFVVPTVVRLQLSCSSAWIPTELEVKELEELNRKPNKFVSFLLEDLPRPPVNQIRHSETYSSIEKLKYIIGSSIKMRFLPFDKIQLLSTILDRRFLNFVKGKRFPGDPTELLLSNYANFKPSDQDIGSQVVIESNEADSFTNFMREILDCDEPQCAADPAELEITEFLSSTPLKSVGKDFDILESWKQENHRFPVLECMASSFLAIPATSVPSERVFSDAGFIVNQKRSNLDPELVDKLIFLHYNDF